MEVTTTNIDLGEAQLQQFLAEFQPAKYKRLKKGVEIRGMVNIHQGLTEAKQLIDRLQLNLNINHTAEMLSYRGFEVLYVTKAG